MPISPEDLAMFESDWPGGDWKDACLATNPRAVGVTDIEAMFRAAW
jgi:hypothetical protein